MFAVQEPKLAAVTSLIQLLYCCAFGHQTADGSHNYYGSDNDGFCSGCEDSVSFLDIVRA